MRKSILFLMVFFISGLAGNLYAFDPMRTPVRTILPKEIKTVGAASQYYADVIGYRLVTSYPAPAESAAIAAEPISPLFFTNKILAVEDAIVAILREPDLLVIDHEHKLFSFAKGEGQ